MLLLDTIIVIIGMAFGIAAMYLIISAFRSLPIPEMQLVLFACIGIFLNLAFFLPIAVLSTPEKVSEFGSVLAVVNITIILSLVSLSFSLWFFLPSMKFTYTSISFVVFITITNTMFAVIGLFTIDYDVIQGNVTQVIDPGTQLLQGFNQLIIVGLIYRRMREIRKVSVGKNLLVFSRRVLTVFFIMIFINVIATAILTQAGFNIPYLIILSIPALFFLFLGYVIREDVSSFLLLPISLYEIIVTHQDTGMVIYSSTKDEETTSQTLIGGLFTALNISLQDAIQAESDMKEVAFGDKIVQLAPGSMITTLFIISEKTLMTSHLASFLTKSFESMFNQEDITEVGNGIISSKFSQFDNVTKSILQLFVVEELKVSTA